MKKWKSLSLGVCLLVAGFAGIARSGERCHLASAFTVQPIPVTPDYTGTQMHADWDVDVTFDATAPYLCACCEYRQHLRSTTTAAASTGMTEDGNPIPLDMVDPANPAATVPIGATLVEDHPNYPGGPIRYGHRSEAKTADEAYTDPGGAPNRATGCRYHGHDRPGLSNLQAGHRYTVDWTFQGSIVCSDNAALCGPASPTAVTAKTWVVSMAKTQ